MKIGNSVKLSGGYDYEPKWLPYDEHVIGEVIKFIPGQNSELAAVIKLPKSITVDSTTGNILVLELRHEGAKWVEEGIVHLELCDFMPDDIRWQDRRQGLWAEAAASYVVQ
ncbi:hypothetical protein [Shewanella colwelliana]|uniref:hypothetical protein n=1 Tax=Shewanella colwelliana TaxID=23 RepID=UPI00048CECD1|nr:hypothetical protein [Shewanella colwelliana]